MVRTPHMAPNRPIQENLPFQRPRLDLEPSTNRTRHKKGRVRRALKKALVYSFFIGFVGLGIAWSQGALDPWAAKAWGKTLSLSVDAGFSLKLVKTKGNQKTPEAAVQEVLGFNLGDPLFGMDMEALQTRVETLPWVKKAFISRELPDTLKINITERTPFARWQIGGRQVVVDEEGVEIHGVETGSYSELPFVVGPGAPKAAPALFEILRGTPTLAERVVAAVRVGERRWDLEFDNGMRLKLPEPNEGYGEAEAWQTFVAWNQEKNILALDVSEADLRLPGKLVMRLTPEGQEAFERQDQKT